MTAATGLTRFSVQLLLRPHLLAHSLSFSGVMSRGLKMTPSINSFLNPSTVFNPSLKPCCANSFTSHSRTLAQCACSLEAFHQRSRHRFFGQVPLAHPCCIRLGTRTAL